MARSGLVPTVLVNWQDATVMCFAAVIDKALRRLLSALLAMAFTRSAAFSPHASSRKACPLAGRASKRCVKELLDF